MEPPKVIPDPTPRFSSHEAAQIAEQVLASPAILPRSRVSEIRISCLRCRGAANSCSRSPKSDEDRAELEFQNAALRQVALRAPALAVPRLSLTRLGEELTQIKDRGGRAHYIRMISWLEGQMLADVASHGEELLALWVIQWRRWTLHCRDSRMLRCIGNCDGTSGARTWPSRICRYCLQNSSDWCACSWRHGRKLIGATLRHGVIHGDANDHNVLVRQGRVAGLIDFGDLVHSAIVCDLAIALAYAMLGKARPMEVAATVVRAYHDRASSQEP